MTSEFHLVSTIGGSSNTSNTRGVCALADAEEDLRGGPWGRSPRYFW